MGFRRLAAGRVVGRRRPWLGPGRIKAVRADPGRRCRPPWHITLRMERGRAMAGHDQLAQTPDGPFDSPRSRTYPLNSRQSSLAMVTRPAAQPAHPASRELATASDAVARVGEARPWTRLLAIQHKRGTCVRTADSVPGPLHSRRRCRVCSPQVWAAWVTQTAANGRHTKDN